ncbi:NACHT and WD repeat domain-containing protein 2-like [Pelobates fuscus]|uniref:NACHT and WD repeat domain-containing protein 2-like n=1 Tax=Pelobates fuscus TaxID=191477 RepID=UPI002FE43AC9
MEEAILCGDFDHIPTEEETGCIQVFLCADPIDSEKERRALRTNVYAKLREYCRHFHGLDFQVLDGYEGVLPEHYYSSSVRKSRMRLLEKCLRSPTGSCFLAFIGEEYGEPCLPAQIDCDEFENVLNAAAENELCTMSLERWYLRDENAIPPVYSLLDKEEDLPHVRMKDGAGPQGLGQDWFYDASREMMKIFHTVVPLCVQAGSMKPKQADKYFNSALEEELLFLLEGHGEDLLERCICYIHKVPYKAMLKQRAISEHIGQHQGYTKLCHIRDSLIPSQSGKMHVYSTTTTCDVKVGYTEEKEQQYIMGLCQQLYADMVKLIQKRRPMSPSFACKNRTEEALQHLSLCNMFADLQQYETKETEDIKKYVLQDTSRKSLMVFGEAASGKTVLLASCAKKIRSWNIDSDPALVIRFVSMLEEPITLNRLLHSLCQQLADIYHREIPRNLESIDVLKKLFAGLLQASTQQRPLYLILDDVDPLIQKENIHWLLFPVPPFTRIIVSITQKKSVEFGLVTSLYQDHTILLEVKPLRKECNANLKMRLMKQNRKITSGQQVYVNRSLATNTSPLQMLLLFKEVTQWKSNKNVDNTSLGENIHKSIETLFCALEMKYGYAILFRALSYITLSRSGIAEAELVDLLSADDMVLAHLHDLNDTVSPLRVPDGLVANILLDLKGCLSQKIVTGFQIVCWANRIYQEVVYSQYLSSSDIENTLHVNMSNYFSGRWACGRSKPVSIKKKHNPPNGEPSLNPDGPNVPVKIYVDCQLPSQPWVFAMQSSQQNTDIGNIRKAYELPFQLKQCGKLDNLYNDVLMKLSYYKVLLKAGLFQFLIHSLDEAAQLTEREEVFFICDLLKEIRCLLNENPDSFENILQSKMASLVSKYPYLLKLAKQLYCEGSKSSSIVVLRTPLTGVQASKVKLPDTSSVVSILEMKAKPLLIIVLENGCVYTSSLRKNITLELQFSAPTQVRDVTLENKGGCLSLFTKNNSFLLLDCSSWVILQEFTFSNSQEPEHIPKSCHLTNMALFVCFKNSPIVRIYNVHSGAILNEVTVSQEVTYFGCDRSGKYTILGQTSTILICKNLDFSLKIHLSLDLNISMHSISYVYIQDSLVYIIDKASNINVWDIDDPTEPQLVDELFTLEEKNEIISSDITPEWLLICRSKTIDVWRTVDWESSHFKPSKDCTFICCVFSPSCEEIIAAVENCSTVFVWNRESGQCISIFQLEDGDISLLTKCLYLRSLVAVTTGGFLMLWDIKAVVSSNAFSQTGRPVKFLLLCPQGSAAYTADGSDMVCKWDILCCKIRNIFSHGDLVEMIILTGNGELLVTSVVSGDLYVWVTETGENIHYIQGNSVSQLLTAPISNIVITLCKDGVSRVWNPTTGHIVCKIHIYLRSAVVTPQGTFLVGLHGDKLLAVSLWSGLVSKEFHQAMEKTSTIVNFQCLKSQPDFLVIMTAVGDIYTWDVVEETVCNQVKLPISFSQPQSSFQVSSNGNTIVLTVNKTVYVFNTRDGQLGLIHEPNIILHQQLTKSGKYCFYVCHGNQTKCHCQFHTNPILNVIKVFNGEKTGQCHLGKMPTAVAMSEDDHTVCLGFEDGTLGLYSVRDMSEGNTSTKHLFSSLTNKRTTENVAVKIFIGKQLADIVWSNSPSIDCSELGLTSKAGLN